MAHNDEDPPWLRPAPVLVLPAKPNPPKRASTLPTNHSAPVSTLLSPPSMSSSGPVAEGKDEEYVGWRPQQIDVQQAIRSPPLSPLDLAMFPGSASSDPRRAGLRPLRILSSKRPGGPASAGASRRSSVESNQPGSGFMGLFAAAKRASVTALTVPSPSSSRRGSGQSTPASHAPIPVSPLPPPRTPPLVLQPAIPAQYAGQVEPALKEYLEALAAQAAPKPSSSRQPSPPPQPAPILEEELFLEIRDLNTGEVIKIKDLDALNPPHPTTSPTASATSESGIGEKTAHPSQVVESNQTRPASPSPPRSPIPHNASQ